MAQQQLKSPVTARPLRSDAQANRERVVAAARAVLARRGPSADMREVAAEAGVGVATVYRTFSTRNAMVEAVVDELVVDFSALLDRAAAESSSRPGIEVLLEGIWALADRHGDVVEALQHQPESASQAEHRLRLEAKLMTILQAGLAEGVVRPQVPLAYVMALIAGLFQLYRSVREQVGREAAVEACAEGFRRAVFAGA